MKRPVLQRTLLAAILSVLIGCNRSDTRAAQTDAIHAGVTRGDWAPAS